MSFMITRKKSYKFSVVFTLVELSSVPLVNGVLFAKCRLIGGSGGGGANFAETSKREEVRDHCVKWQTKYSFSCKMSANANTGILESRILRASVRKESKGGRSYHKIGFVDIDLAEYAGAGLLSRRYLLEGYDTKHRLDNSTLNVSIEMSLLSGDPCFKTPTQAAHRTSAPLSSSSPKAHKHYDAVGGGGNGNSVLAAQLTPTSATPPPSTKTTTTTTTTTPQSATGQTQQSGIANAVANDYESGHSRNSSQASRVSGYNSLPSHSRQGSADSGSTRASLEAIKFNSTERKRLTQNAKKIIEEQSRMDSTRMSADRLIDKLLAESNLDGDEEYNESVGLELIVGKDGTTTLGTRHGNSNSRQQQQQQSRTGAHNNTSAQQQQQYNNKVAFIPSTAVLTTTTTTIQPSPPPMVHRNGRN
ncbi:EEIG family member 2-like [Oppia nitens]|uniref:EEIG family member 2-like n=1 Tax=Oppia nitens TaxID=1686743 RepID=UPI0023DBD79A|nr:EEIG family member 2-like [Oppia nitens]